MPEGAATGDGMLDLDPAGPAGVDPAGRVQDETLNVELPLGPQARGRFLLEQAWVLVGGQAREVGSVVLRDGHQVTLSTLRLVR